MTGETTFRALVVDDEAMIRQATIRALGSAGFVCDPAADGREAQQILKTSLYDAVVTDLRMPETNGYALATELLALPQRPIIVVVTGIVDGRLESDLRTRGVDEVFFKPVNYEVLGSTLKALAARRRDRLSRAAASSSKPSITGCAPPPTPGIVALTTADSTGIASEVSNLVKTLPMPPSCFDAFKMSGSESLNSTDLAAAVQANPGIAVEVLRLVNSIVYSATQRIKELEVSAQSKAVKIGEPQVILPLSAFAAGTVLGWLLTWFSLGAWLVK